MSFHMNQVQANQDKTVKLVHILSAWLSVFTRLKGLTAAVIRRRQIRQDTKTKSMPREFGQKRNTEIHHSWQSERKYLLQLNEVKEILETEEESKQGIASMGHSERPNQTHWPTGGLGRYLSHVMTTWTLLRIGFDTYGRSPRRIRLGMVLCR